MRFGWNDSYQALIVPGMISAFGIFMFRQHFKTIPQDLLDAARVDGASDLTILFKIIWPLSTAVIITVGIFTFMGGWNDFLWPTIVNRELEYQTLTQMVTLYGIGGQAGRAGGLGHGGHADCRAAHDCRVSGVSALLPRGHHLLGRQGLGGARDRRLNHKL